MSTNNCTLAEELRMLGEECRNKADEAGAISMPFVWTALALMPGRKHYLSNAETFCVVCNCAHFQGFNLENENL